MLKHEDNEKICRVGPGTPMGDLMRRYWQPAALSSELPERDGAPIRVRLLGEDLVAFRDTNGRIGLVAAYCPHRRAPLFFGRNEECGLRCVYHGWKFDADGNCVDLPSEAATSPMKNGVKITAYPTVERGGLVWAYMGPKEHQPGPPDFEWTRVPSTHCHVSKTFEDCNWLQALEGGLDTAHGSFLHNNQLGNKKLLRQRDGAPKIDVEKTDYGYYYVSTRKPQPDEHYVRVYQYIMPAQQMRANVMGREGGRNDIPKLDGHVWVPVDDGHCCVYNWCYAYDQSTPISDEYYEAIEKSYGRGKDDFIPGTFTPEAQPGERLHDRSPDAEDEELHRHRRHQHPGLRAAGRHGPRAWRGGSRRSHAGASRHLRSRDRFHAPLAARGDRQCRRRRQTARRRSAIPSRRAAA